MENIETYSINKQKYLDIFVETLLNQVFDNIDGQAVVFDNVNHYLQAPRKLYRYCKFDKNKFTLDSIENKYVYLSPAILLDDDFECIFNENDFILGNIEDLIDTEHYFDYFVKKLLEKYGVYNPITHLIFKKDGLEDKHDFYFWHRYLIEDAHLNIDLATSLAGYILAYTNNKKEFAKECKKIIDGFLVRKDRAGICSFTTNNHSQVMWNMYADNYKGIMIEYDFNIYDISNIIDIFPVQYINKRKTDPLEIVLDIFVNYFNKNERTLVKEQFKALYNILSIKNEEWSFQDEWRIAGKPKTKSPSPRIRAIYLGNKINPKNKKKIMELSSKMLFKVYEQQFDIANTEIIYKDITNIKSDLFEKNLFINNSNVPFLEYTYDEIESLIYADIFYPSMQWRFNDDYVIYKNGKYGKYNYNYVCKAKTSKNDLLFEVKYWPALPCDIEFEPFINNLKLKEKEYTKITKRDAKMNLFVFVKETIFYDMQYLYSIFDSDLHIEYFNCNTFMPFRQFEINEKTKEFFRKSKPLG